MDDDVPHDTPAGYLHHQRKGIPHEVCGGACRRKWAARQRKYRQEHPGT